MEYFMAVVIVGILFIAINVAIARWVFRINTLVSRLDSIISQLKLTNESITRLAPETMPIKIE